MIRPTVNLDDAVAYLRELLFMDRTELLKAANFARVHDKLKKSDMIVYAFEKHFNVNAIDPTSMPPAGKVRPDGMYNYRAPVVKK